MTTATDIELDPQKEGNKIVSYTVFCIIHDENLGNGKRRIRFKLDEAFVKALPKAANAKNAAIGDEIRERIRGEFAKWQSRDAENKAKIPPEAGEALATKLGFNEMVDADFA